MPTNRTPNKTCEQCGAGYWVKPSRFDTSKYCSKQCGWDAKRKPPLFKTCLYCGEVFTRESRRDLLEAVYCSYSCAARYRRDNNLPGYQRKAPLVKTCAQCGVTFTRPDWKAYRDAVFCSYRCTAKYKWDHNIHRPKRSVLPESYVNKTCDHCGTVFPVKACYARRQRVFSCSPECKAENIRKKKTKERVTFTCAWCGVHCDLSHSEGFEGVGVRRRRRMFCSLSCAGSYNMRRMPRISSLETLVAAELDRLNEAYQQQVRLGRFLCDFYLPERQLYIECDGTYWHGPDFPGVQARDRSKDTYCANRGISLVRLAEDDIRFHLETKLGWVLENYPVTQRPAALTGWGQMPSYPEDARLRRADPSARR